MAAGFAAAAIAAGVLRAGSGWWLPLHLFVVGGLLSAISATTQMLAVTWSAAPAPRPVVAGGTAVIVAMGALVAILWQVRRRAATDRFAPAIEAYIGAVAAGTVGMSLGLVLGTGRAGSHAGELRGAHLILNVFGLVGVVIAGTLPYFHGRRAGVVGSDDRGVGGRHGEAK